MNQTDETFLTIGELSDKTSVNTVTLRAWERRYGILKPQRNPKGHRLYSQNDLKTIQQVLNFIERGVPLRKIKPLLEGKETLQDLQPDKAGIEWQQKIRQQLEHTNLAGLVQAIKEMFKQYPANWCRKQVVEPLFSQLIGHRFQAAFESLFEAELLRYVARFQAAKPGKQQENLWILASETTAAWRPALLSLEIGETKASSWLPGSFTIPALEQILLLNPAQNLLYYFDGVMSEEQIKQLQSLLNHHPNLHLKGTAVSLSFAGHNQIWL